MPVNVNLPSSPEPDEPDQNEAEQSLEIERDAEAVQQTAPEAEQPAKRKRRTKAEMLEDAVIPADGDAVKLKDVGTGVKIERPWVEAVALVDDGKAEWVDKDMKYARIKYAQQAAPASPDQASPKTDAFGRPSPEQLETAQLPTDISGQMVAPEGAELGDEVIVGADTYYVGHGHVLVDGYVVDDRGEFTTPKRRWQRVLGTGSNGPWESRALAGHQEPTAPVEQAEEKLAVEQTQNGKADLDVQTERLPRTMEEVEPGTLKIGTGMLDKIGLPDYSSLQIGPITMSRTVQDDGRRHTEVVKGREVTVITAAVEAFEELDNTIEFVGARFRGQLQSFLESTGALKQPA